MNNPLSKYRLPQPDAAGLRSFSRSPFTIEILGVVSPNKGADLMFEAIRKWVRTLPVSCRLAVRWQAPPQKRRMYGLWTKVWHGKGCRVPYGLFMEFLPETLVRRLKVVRDKDIHLVLDASGFGYGDHSGVEGAHSRTGGRIAVWKKQGTKVVLLPQAYGPFSDKQLEGEMKHILGLADLVYARDSRSLEYLRRIYPEGENLQHCPDITALVDGMEFAEMKGLAGLVGIIPNYKTFTESACTTQEEYVSFLVGVVDLIHASGKKVALILHEGEKDESICEEICRASKGSPLFIKRDNPLEVKYAIGQCEAVLSSRFHGLASALFQGVPAISTSWSHKYEQLAGEFGVSDVVLSSLDPMQASRQLLAFCDPINRKGLSDSLLRHSAKKKAAVAKMWKHIEVVIQSDIEARQSVMSD